MLEQLPFFCFFNVGTVAFFCFFNVGTIAFFPVGLMLEQLPFFL